MHEFGHALNAYIWMLLAGGNRRANSKRKLVSSENKSRGRWVPGMTHFGSGLFR